MAARAAYHVGAMAQTPPGESYIRGASVGTVDQRRVGWAVAIICLVSLAGSAVWLTAYTASNRSAADRLRSHGVPVTVTVTGCTGITSGVGMGVEYFDCRGDYTDGGSARRDVLIHGVRAARQPGTTLQAVAVPGDASSLTLASTVGRGSPSWAGPVALWVSTVVLGAALVFLRRRHRSVAPA
jgi:hypothetical protein